jgi:excisionase family DNA binding protein
VILIFLALIAQGASRSKFARRPRRIKLETLADQSDILSVAEVATYLKLSPGTARNLVKAGKLPCVKIGRSLRFSRRQPAAI